MRATVTFIAIVISVGVARASIDAAQQPQGGGRGQQAAAAPQAPRTPRSIAPIDLTGTWVSIVDEDWRWRMMTPPKGDYASLPLNPEGKKVADAFDLAKDEAAGEACRPFGAAGIMRMPTRIRISWQDDTTLKLEFDAGTQTRLLHFDSKTAPGERSWQGYSAAAWEIAGQQQAVDRNGIPQGPSPDQLGQARGRGRGAAAPVGGSLRVVTTNMREGYLRKNGYPYSQDATMTEYFDRISYPNGDIALIVRAEIVDPKYLQLPYVTSPHFKKEPNDAKWKASPCKIDPPSERGK